MLLLASTIGCFLPRHRNGFSRCCHSSVVLSHAFLHAFACFFCLLSASFCLCMLYFAFACCLLPVYACFCRCMLPSTFACLISLSSAFLLPLYALFDRLSCVLAWFLLPLYACAVAWHAYRLSLFAHRLPQSMYEAGYGQTQPCPDIALVH